MTLSNEIESALRKELRGQLRTDRAARILYSTDASIYQIEPLGVFLPRDRDDLQAVVELAARYSIPILPRGSGSSLAGQAIGPALIVDCSRWLDHILEIDPEGRTATVEPGVVLDSLNRALAKHGLQFGPDPASAERATLGGVIANNATGAHSILYGMAADHVKSADVILSDGSAARWEEMDPGSRVSGGERMQAILGSIQDIRSKYTDAIQEGFPRSWRNSAGYRLNYLLPWSPSHPPRWGHGAYPPVYPGKVNLAQLLAGSEGTLAMIRRLTLNLVPRPRVTILALLAYESIDAACDDVPRLLKYDPSAIELIPQSIIRLAHSVPAYSARAAFMDLGAEALLVVEFSGEDGTSLVRLASTLQPVLIAESAEDQTRIWNVRKVGLGLLASRAGDAKTVAFIEDCAIPVERLGDFVRGVEGILHEYGTKAEYYAHASAGCLHVRPILDLKREVKALRGIAEAVLQLTLALGGSMSSEHGDGLARSEWLQQTYGESVMQAFRDLKQAADPQGILNPAKILDAPPMDSNLRYSPAYRSEVWPSPLDFTEQGGLAGAIEQCNGQGVCRKDSGMMCPSFQATREEMHSTRGRANLLRAMISRPPEGVMTEDVHAALDLCLACKGCKSECPSGVDMARLKFAFLAEYHKTHRRQIRDYIFGYFHTVSALFAPISPLVNAVLGFAPTRRLIAQMTGITPARPFPVYSRTRARQKRSGKTTPFQKVLFLCDAFTHFIEPEVEQAAFDLLAAVGVEAQVIPVMGAGAALLSKGFADAAKRHAGKLLDHINRLDPLGECAVVGLEPPELYMLKNDIGALLPRRKEQLARLASRVWLLDEYLIRSETFPMLQAAVRNRNGQAVGTKLRFQPHCHQRAEAPAADGLPSGAEATIRLLKSCGFGDTAQIPGGCCGMAGTFGYEAEHYDLSRQVGELNLFPYLRQTQKTDPGTVFLASGSACRLQIEQGLKVESMHPLVFLSQFL